MHLYLDIAWFGVASGTTIAFMTVFATRQGASGFQIGLLSAVPALVNLLFALPAGSWLGRRPLGRAVFWAAVFSRLIYVILIPLPVLLAPESQVWVIILTTLFTAIPGTAQVVGFNAMFGAAVPVDWRGHVVGIRNAILALFTTLFTLISGQILERMAFPTGYQVVFSIGLVGAMMSALHLLLLGRLVKEQGRRGPIPYSAPQGSNGRGARRLQDEINALVQRSLQTLRLDVMSGKFARLMGLLFFWHVVQFLSIPVITPHIVNNLNFSDQAISLSNSLFNVTMFFGSLYLSTATRRYGNRMLTGAGIVGLSVFPLLTAAAQGPGLYALANLLGGLAWAMTGGALYNFILERSPDHDRPAYLAWYSLVSNAAILIGSLSGPAIAGAIGFPLALFLFGVGRVLAGFAILKWG